MIAFHPSWPAQAQTLLRRAIDRHGGWSLWARLEAITINLRSLRGLLPWLKGSGRTFQISRSLTTFPHQGRTEWRAEPGTPCVAVFDRGDMRLLAPDGQVSAESPDHRRTFRGLRKLRRWDALDAHYFFGYAFASYGAVPFALPALPFRGAVSVTRRGERLEGVRVEWAPADQVHSRLQSYFFEASGLLRRNDYVADVIGPWVAGAHYWDDYTTVEGLPLPTRRVVVPRLGRIALPGPAAIDATFEGLGVRLHTAPSG